MLGWDVRVYWQANDRAEPILLARWSTGAFGLSLLDKLVDEKKADDLGGDGYPCRYSVAAWVLLPILMAGLPANQSPPVIGEDYVMPAGYNGALELHKGEIRRCPADAQLIVEAWDQS